MIPHHFLGVLLRMGSYRAVTVRERMPASERIGDEGRHRPPLLFDDIADGFPNILVFP